MLKNVEDVLKRLKTFEDIDLDVTYNVLLKIIKDPLAMVIQSENNDFIAVQNVGRPLWLYVDLSLSEIIIDAYIKEFINMMKEEVTSIVGDQVIVDKVIKAMAKLHTIEDKNTVGMLAYSCENPKSEDRTDHYLKKAEIIDLVTVASFLKGYGQEAHGENVSLESQMDAAKKLVDTGHLYVLQCDKTLVCMANIADQSDLYARVNTVYTPKTHRNKGYAGHLVARLSMQILKSGLIPMLYTDDSNEIANRVYSNIGYKLSGQLIQVSFNESC